MVTLEVKKTYIDWLSWLLADLPSCIIVFLISDLPTPTPNPNHVTTEILKRSWSLVLAAQEKEKKETSSIRKLVMRCGQISYPMSSLLIAW